MTDTFERACSEADREKKAAEQATKDANGKRADDADDADDSKRPKQADILIGLSNEVSLFHTPDGEAFADINVDKIIARRTESVAKPSGNGFAISISNRQKAASIPTRCRSPSRRSPPRRRSREKNTKFISELPSMRATAHIDIGDASWRAIKASRAGWDVVAEPPVRFQRSLGTRALPIPERGGSIQLIETILQCGVGRRLCVASRLCPRALWPNTNYVILVVTGEQGWCKSTTIRFIVWLTDPREARDRSFPRNEEDLITAAKGAASSKLR